jgi:hypothetical protein
MRGWLSQTVGSKLVSTEKSTKFKISPRFVDPWHVMDSRDSRAKASRLIVFDDKIKKLEKSLRNCFDSDSKRLRTQVGRVFLV